MSTGVFQQPIRWAQRFLELGVREQDSRDERLRKAIVNLLALMVITGAPLEGWEAWHSGSSESVTLIFGCLTVMTAVGLAHMWSTGRRTLLQRSIFVLGLASAGISHVEYGGAMGSMAYILWGSLTPVCALLLCSRREARFWTLLYLGMATGLIVAELYLDIPFTKAPRPATVWLGLSIPVFYFLTIVLVLDYFVLQLEKARKELQDEHERLQVEKARSERLLLNVLPAAIATRLKDEDETIADDFREVSVLFADIVGFTELSARLEPQELVSLLNQLFTVFDDLADQHGVEKIKTIGDAYMAASGLPEPRSDHATAIADLALQMQRAIVEFRTGHGYDLDIRIGVNSGPVVAGVIGRRKFIYDLWGDAVNIASRMESHGERGRIQVSRSTQALISDSHELEDRGTIQVKGKGPMQTFFLLGRRDPAASAPVSSNAS